MSRLQVFERFTYLGISATLLLLTGILYLRDSGAFHVFLGELNPVLVILALSILGFVLLSSLKSLGFSVYRVGDDRQRLIYLALAPVLALVMIVVDILVVFPEDLNLLFPWSLIYYPMLGYIVEVLFHLASTFLILLVFKKLGLLGERSMLLCILLVSLLEPVFQIGLGFSHQIPLWAVTVVFLQIYVINLQQLRIFRRFDFTSMYAFRLLYYLFWHILWGNLRLVVLF